MNRQSIGSLIKCYRPLLLSFHALLRRYILRTHSPLFVLPFFFCLRYFLLDARHHPLPGLSTGHPSLAPTVGHGRPAPKPGWLSASLLFFSGRVCLLRIVCYGRATEYYYVSTACAYSVRITLDMHVRRWYEVVPVAHCTCGKATDPDLGGFRPAPRN